MSAILNEINKLDLRKDMLSQTDLAAFEGSDLSRLSAQAPALWHQIQFQAKQLKAAPVRVLIDRLPPKAAIPVHTDGGPHYARHHFPVTQPVHIWDEHYGHRVFPVGEWSDHIPHWVQHTVWNPADEDRVNVIVDFDTIVDVT